jgi:hypothetical protein
MAAAWDLCEELGMLVNTALAFGPENVSQLGSVGLHKRCDKALALLSRISSDIRKSIAERYGEEEVS